MAAKDKKVSWGKFQKLRYTGSSLGRKVRDLEKSSLRHARRFVSSRLDRLSDVRRAIFGWVVLVCVLAVVSGIQWAGFRGSYTVVSHGAGGTYSEGVLGPLETLNPIFARSSAERSAAKLLFASLYSYDTTGHIKGDLAESVEINSEETEYTVKLRKGAVWSDGAPLTAKDVVFTVDLLRDSDTRAEISGWSSFSAQMVDSRTVKFSLPGSYAPFMHVLTFPVLPQHALAGVKPAELREQPFSQSPITSGPFALRMLQNITPDGGKKIAHLVANSRYIHGAPKLARFQLNVYASRDDITTALKTNEIMATPELEYSSMPDQIKKVYQSNSYAVNNGVYALFNTGSGPLKSSAIREALTLSVNRDALGSKIARSAAPLEGPVLSSQVSGDLPSGYAYDIAKSKEILDKEGWHLVDGLRSKDGSHLQIKMVALKGAGFSETTEELAKIWRKELGVKVEVQIVDPLDPSQSVLQSILQPRNFDILVYELVLGGDPDVYAYWHSSRATTNGLNFSSYSNIIADEALSSGRAKRGEKHRADRYKAFVRRWLADTPALPLYQPKIDMIHIASAATIDKDSALVSPEDRFANVTYWTVDSTTVYKTP